MKQLEVINILKTSLNFSDHSIEKLKKFTNLVLKENKNYNLIAKSTENQIWHRHILDSAQLVKFINFSTKSLADLGSGAGFPGLVVEIFNRLVGKIKIFFKNIYDFKLLHQADALYLSFLMCERRIIIAAGVTPSIRIA